MEAKQEASAASEQATGMVAASKRRASQAANALGGAMKQPVSSIDRLVARSADALWGELRRHPYFGVVAAGGVGLAAATVVGGAEIALGVLAGYAAYQMIMKREPPSQALCDAVRFERELGV
jgi:hypothetical protein